MAWFGRRRDDAAEPEEPADTSPTLDLSAAGDTLADDGAALRPVVAPLGEDERNRIAAALEALAGEGVDVDDLDSLSGGLDAGNVGEAICRTGAPLVDVSSGVESAPGVKDMDKIAGFLKAVATNQ